MDSPASFYRRGGKRLFDVAVSLLGLVLLAPVLVLLALLVRIFLGAPVFYRQQRSGRGQKTFTILKFRTMTDARDASGKLLPDSQRLTRFGRLLRHTSLDELPELINVLKGEMSLVGPRPLIPRYGPYFREEELPRFDVLPGITGWAQINGRNDIDWDRRFVHDVWYVGALSFVLDVKILLLTVVKVIRRDNVQVDPALTFQSLDEVRLTPARLNNDRRDSGLVTESAALTPTGA